MKDGKVIVKRQPVIDKAERAEKADKVNNTENFTQDKKAQEMSVLVSGILRRENKTFVRVSFLRGKDWAEGIVPDGVIDKSEGFTKEEIQKLEDYLTGDKEKIISQAKGINPIRNLFQI